MKHQRPSERFLKVSEGGSKHPLPHSVVERLKVSKRLKQGTKPLRTHQTGEKRCFSPYAEYCFTVESNPPSLFTYPVHSGFRSMVGAPILLPEAR